MDFFNFLGTEIFLKNVDAYKSTDAREDIKRELEAAGNRTPVL
jgi:hypothetical protein